MTPPAVEIPTLSVESILSAARLEAGLEDFGDDGIVEPLGQLVASLRAEADLNPAGVIGLHSHYVRLLVNRLRYQRDRNAHPDILKEQVAPPIAVIGMPRSGTTKLHRVLAADPGLAALPTWQLMNPAPFPPSTEAATDPRLAFAEGFFAEFKQHHPEVFAGHPMSATDPDEETSYLMEMTFDGPLVPVRAYVPTFTSWRWSRSMAPAYRFLREMLAYLQWQQRAGRAASPTFVLKSPLHLGHIEQFAAEFPGMTIAHCHRDPVSSVPSFARLLEVGWAMMTDVVDLERCGRESLALLKTHTDRYLAQRAGIEHRVNFVDVPFRAIVSDPMPLVEEVYGRHGRKVPADMGRYVREWERDNKADRFGKHAYTLERYGLTEAAIGQAFAEYYDRFGALVR